LSASAESPRVLLTLVQATFVLMRISWLAMPSSRPDPVPISDF
jgi:hypothetical protein